MEFLVNGSNYYSKNFIEYKKIFQQIDDDGILVKNAKDALNSKGSAKNLCTISSSYKCLVERIDQLEGSTLGIKEAYNILTNFHSGDDIVDIKNYIDLRLSKNWISGIISMFNENISSNTYAKLLNCQARSSLVERSFSLLK